MSAKQTSLPRDRRGALESGGKALHRLILESRKYSVGQFKAMSHTSFDLVLYGNFYQKRYLLYNWRQGFHFGIPRWILSAAICSPLFFTRLIGVSKPSFVKRALGTRTYIWVKSPQFSRLLLLSSVAFKFDYHDFSFSLSFCFLFEGTKIIKQEPATTNKLDNNQLKFFISVY